MTPPEPARGASTPETGSPLASVERIVVRGVNWLGDAIMSTPALGRLREAYPGAAITLVGPEKLKALWDNHPAVDSVWAIDPHETLWHLSRRIRQGGFQLGVVFPNSPRSALELWWGRVPRRFGYAALWRTWCLTDAVPPRPGGVRMQKRSAREIRRLIGVTDSPATSGLPDEAHHVHHYLHLAARLGADPKPLRPEIEVTSGEVETVCRRFQIPTREVDDRPWYGLNPGAEYGPAKRWPVERYAAAAQELHRRTGCRWMVFGGGADRRLAEEITGRVQSAIGKRSDVAIRSLAGTTDLRELCALLKRCRVLLTNDTGPMHVAAAVGTPVVVPFGSTSPGLTGPGLPGDDRHRVLQAGVACAPCYRRRCPIDFRCMQRIDVPEVVQAVLEVV